MEPNTYDEVPYDNLAFAQTHPDRLATTARMFGLEPPSVATARVLELGCASGGNLIPMAFNLPDAEFVGIDLSRRHVDTSLSTIHALEMRNIRIVHGSILDIDESWGLFDYIICHGVFSWVEPHVQEAILRIAADNLVENGIAYISYNTYPGWHMRETVRHMMRYHAGRFDEPTEQIEQARALLEFLASAADDTGPYGQLLTREIEKLSGASDSYLFHEHLEPTNAPLYFHQFVERAERAGLQYLAEATVSDMLSSVFPRDVGDTLERISPDLVHLEQYMDFVRNRLFRQTLLCHETQRPKRALNPARMQRLLLSTRAITDPAPPDLTLMTPVVFHNGEQRATVSLPGSKAAFTILMEQWPHAVEIHALGAAAMERAAPFLESGSADDVPATIMGDLFQAVLHGMIRLHTGQVSCTNRPSERPRALRYVTHRARTSTIVINAHHESVRLEPFGREVLLLCDGRHTRLEMVELLAARVASGEMTFDLGGKAESERAVDAMLEREVLQTLAALGRHALLDE